MRRSPFQITLTPTEARKLEQIVRCTTAPAGRVQRARIILRFAAGRTVSHLARDLRLPRVTSPATRY